MGRIKCFMMEPAMMARRYLRRYITGTQCEHGQHGYHNVRVQIEDAPLVIGTSQGSCGVYKHWELVTGLEHDRSDPRWPTHCKCGYAFTEKDEWQLFYEPLYRRLDTGSLHTLTDAPPGAMWYDLQDDTDRAGPDGKRLYVMTPGGDWGIDWRASNCTMPHDKEHRCWVRHGVPPEVTVDKNGYTCAAGAGSIIRGSYHGFLRNGYLEGC